MPQISVIIPCFNQGQYVDEAIQSVLAQTFQDFEIVVVNDGSTDPGTIERLGALSFPKMRVLHTENLGLPEARNLAIRNAVGEFILPLDADDKIAPTYLEAAREVLAGGETIGIVSCNAEFFGEVSGPWHCLDYQFPDILFSPRIHASSLFRKADWEKVGGYSGDMIYGWEDYDLWLSFLEIGRKVHRLPEALFYYRQHGKSMTKELTNKRHRELFSKIFERHRKFYEENMGELLFTSSSLVVSDFGHKGQVQILEAQVKILERQRDERTAYIERLEKQCQERALEADCLSKRVWSLQQSRSWRMTAPLRMVGNLFSSKDEFVQSLETEIRILFWKAFVRFPLSAGAKAIHRRAQRIAKSGLFDSFWYASQYEGMPGVMAHPLLHFLLIGAQKGCDPNPLFSTNWYSREHPEASADGMNPLLHYIEQGSLRHFDPGPHFNSRRYISENPDVDWSKTDPLSHFFHRRYR